MQVIYFLAMALTSESFIAERAQVHNYTSGQKKKSITHGRHQRHHITCLDRVCLSDPGFAVFYLLKYSPHTFSRSWEWYLCRHFPIIIACKHCSLIRGRICDQFCVFERLVWPWWPCLVSSASLVVDQFFSQAWSHFYKVGCHRRRLHMMMMDSWLGLTPLSQIKDTC